MPYVLSSPRGGNENTYLVVLTLQVMIFTSSISNTTQQNTLPSSKIREISPHPKLLPEI
jgi:hypothetical protein